MNESSRWRDQENNALRQQLLRAAVEESLPNGALLRAGRRFGLSAAVVQASSAGLAKAALANATLVNGAKGTMVFATLTKALLVGLSAGMVLVGASQWSMRRARVGTPRAAPATTVTASRLSASDLRAATEPAQPSSTTAVTDPAQQPEVLVESPIFTEKPKPALETKQPLSTRMAKDPDPIPQRVELAISAPDAQKHRASDSATSAVARFNNESELPHLAAPTAEPLSAAATSSAPPVLQSPTSLSLAQEVKMLDRVRIALRTGDPRLALADLEREIQRGSLRRLHHEAAVLRVEALGALGRRKEAALLARQLLTADLSPSQRKLLERWMKSETE